jgi:hypothetical protein
MEAHQRLDEILKVVESARSLPMSSSVVLNRNELTELLGELRDALPPELQAAQDVLRKRDTLLYETTSNAERLLEAAAEEGRRLVSEEEVVRAARIEAAEMLQAARDESDRMSRDVDGYVDAKLAHLEVSVNNILEAIRKGREHLSASAGLYGNLAAEDTGVPRELSEPSEAPRELGRDMQVDRVADVSTPTPAFPQQQLPQQQLPQQQLPQQQLPQSPSELPAATPAAPSDAPHQVPPAVRAFSAARHQVPPSGSPLSESTSPSPYAAEFSGHPDGLRRPGAPPGGENGRGWTPDESALLPTGDQPGEHDAEPEHRGASDPGNPPNGTLSEAADVDLNSET